MGTRRVVARGPVVDWISQLLHNVVGDVSEARLTHMWLHIAVLAQERLQTLILLFVDDDRRNRGLAPRDGLHHGERLWSQQVFRALGAARGFSVNDEGVWLLVVDIRRKVDGLFLSLA